MELTTFSGKKQRNAEKTAGKEKTRKQFVFSKYPNRCWSEPQIGFYSETKPLKKEVIKLTK